MAKYRYVYTSFWNDPRVVEEMTAEDKYFFLYLLTNESTTQIGIYQITKKQIAFDMGYSMESAGALIQRFRDHHKLIKYNEETREIAIKNWGKYNLVRGGKPIIDCVTSELKEVKDVSLIQWVGEGITNEPVRNVYESYYKVHENGECSNNTGSDDTFTIRGQKENKKEKEKEKENKKEKREGDKPLPPSSHIDPIFLKIVDHFEKNVIYEEAAYLHRKTIDDMMHEYDSELIIKAMDIAVERGKPHLRYINGILRAWQTDGIINVQQLERGQQHANNRGSSKQFGSDEYDGLSL